MWNSAGFPTPQIRKSPKHSLWASSDSSSFVIHFIGLALSGTGTKLLIVPHVWLQKPTSVAVASAKQRVLWKFWMLFAVWTNQGDCHGCYVLIKHCASFSRSQMLLKVVEFQGFISCCNILSVCTSARAPRLIFLLKSASVWKWTYSLINWLARFWVFPKCYRSKCSEALVRARNKTYWTRITIFAVHHYTHTVHPVPFQIMFFETFQNDYLIDICMGYIFIWPQVTCSHISATWH